MKKNPQADPENPPEAGHPHIATDFSRTQPGITNLAGAELVLFEKIVGVIIAGVFIYINFKGSSETGTMGSFFTLGQTAALLFIAAAGIWVAVSDPDRLRNPVPGRTHESFRVQK